MRKIGQKVMVRLDPNLHVPGTAEAWAGSRGIVIKIDHGPSPRAVLVEITSDLHFGRQVRIEDHEAVLENIIIDEDPF